MVRTYAYKHVAHAQIKLLNEWTNFFEWKKLNFIIIIIIIIIISKRSIQMNVWFKLFRSNAIFLTET